jgi:predicted RNA-binding protein
MCESSAYLRHDGEDQLLLEDVVWMKPDGPKIVLTNILGEKKELRAIIDHIDLLHHKIILKET